MVNLVQICVVKCSDFELSVFRATRYLPQNTFNVKDTAVGPLLFFLINDRHDCDDASRSSRILFFLEEIRFD